MHTEMDIIAAVRGGELPALTSETLPIVAARQKELNERFARAMHSPYVGGRRLPHAITASARNPNFRIECLAKRKSAKVDRARAVELLLKANDLCRRK